MEGRGGFKMDAHGRVHREGRAQWVSGERQRFNRWRVLVRAGDEGTVSCLSGGLRACGKVLPLILSLDEVVGGA